ncbi:MAG: class II aldolase/adducin family protein [Alphaproteobacteria bacterium]
MVQDRADSQGPGPHALRTRIIETARAMNAAGINHNAAGNVSARSGGGFLITPTGLRYSDLVPSDISEMSIAVGGGEAAEGSRLPSSEWRFHHDIYLTRPDAGAVVHTHSPAATALSCLRRDIPPFHYMVAAAGGASIRCADYAIYGSQQLSDNALAALADRKACLLANHGVIALGADLETAFELAVEVEALAGQYLTALAVAEPILLTDAEITEAIEKFATYGQQKSRAD